MTKNEQERDITRLNEVVQKLAEELAILEDVSGMGFRLESLVQPLLQVIGLHLKPKDMAELAHQEIAN